MTQAAERAKHSFKLSNAYSVKFNDLRMEEYEMKLLIAILLLLLFFAVVLLLGFVAGVVAAVQMKEVMKHER